MALNASEALPQTDKYWLLASGYWSLGTGIWLIIHSFYLTSSQKQAASNQYFEAKHRQMFILL